MMHGNICSTSWHDRKMGSPNIKGIRELTLHYIFYRIIRGQRNRKIWPNYKCTNVFMKSPCTVHLKSSILPLEGLYPTTWSPLSNHLKSSILPLEVLYPTTWSPLTYHLKSSFLPLEVLYPTITIVGQKEDKILLLCMWTGRKCNLIQSVPRFPWWRPVIALLHYRVPHYSLEHS